MLRTSAVTDHGWHVAILVKTSVTEDFLSCGVSAMVGIERPDVWGRLVHIHLGPVRFRCIDLDGQDNEQADTRIDQRVTGD